VPLANTTNGALTVAGGGMLGGMVTLTSTVSPTVVVNGGTSAGALTVAGGVGVGGNLAVQGNVGLANQQVVVNSPSGTVYLASTASPTNAAPLSGALTVAGGIGVGGNVVITNTTPAQTLQGASPATAWTSGALVVAGGVGGGGSMSVVGDIVSAGVIYSVSTTGTTVVKSLATVNSVQTSQGALVVAGGVGIGGNVYVGNSFYAAGNAFTVNGQTGAVMSREIEEKLRYMFKEIQPSFQTHCPKDRNNFLSYSYVLYKFCELLELDEYLSCFQLLKNRDKLYIQDKIWQKICADLSWQFIRSI